MTLVASNHPDNLVIWSVIVAAGSGTRFGGAKQFAELAGQTVVERSTGALRPHSAGIVVVVAADQLDEWSRGRAVAADVGCPVVAAIGGATRSESVRAGLAAVPGDADIVLVHDAARPLVTSDLIERVIDAVAEGAVAVVPGVPVTDTIRTIGGGVLDRTLLVAVQTPQGFRAPTLRAAHSHGVDATDDAAVVESMGGTVTVVPGDPTNLKLTSPTDLAVALALLAERAPR